MVKTTSATFWNNLSHRQTDCRNHHLSFAEIIRQYTRCVKKGPSYTYVDVLIFIVVATIKLYTAVYVEVGNLHIKFYVRAIVFQKSAKYFEGGYFWCSVYSVRILLALLDSVVPFWEN